MFDDNAVVLGDRRKKRREIFQKERVLMILYLSLAPTLLLFLAGLQRSKKGTKVS